MYTIVGKSGQRDLRIEKALSHLEGKFARTRRSKLDKTLPLDEEDLAYVCTFVAAMWTRTKAYREHLRSTWGKALDLMEKVEEAHKKAPSVVRSVGTFQSGSGRRSPTSDPSAPAVRRPRASRLVPPMAVVSPPPPSFSRAPAGAASPPAPRPPSLSSLPGLRAVDRPCDAGEQDRRSQRPGGGHGPLLGRPPAKPLDDHDDHDRKERQHGQTGQHAAGDEHDDEGENDDAGLLSSASRPEPVPRPTQELRHPSPLVSCVWP